MMLPVLFWWLAGRGIVALPGMDAVSFMAAYPHFFRHLHEPLMLAATILPYVMFVGARLLQEQTVTAPALRAEHEPARAKPAEVHRIKPARVGKVTDSAAPEQSLHQAAMRGDAGLTLQLLEQGADFNAADPASGYTPLQIAALQGHAAICDALIRYGAAVDAMTARHETALHLAAQSAHADAVSTLLKYRANTDVRNSSGQTALQLAQLHGHAAVVRIMEDHASREWPYLRLAHG
ncbi:MAG: ankyrin repeat domain-containing protein [Pseudomonadota bacterium]